MRGYQELQREILYNASQFVRPGGRLVYATCSLDPSENTAVANGFEATNPGFERLPFPSAFPGLLHWPVTPCEGAEEDAYGGSRRWLLPHVHNSDGFFIARWRRRGGRERGEDGGQLGGA